jgi:hypothetical protein
MGVEGVTTTFFSVVVVLAVLPPLLTGRLLVVFDESDEPDLVDSQPIIVKNMLMKTV